MRELLSRKQSTPCTRRVLMESVSLVEFEPACMDLRRRKCLLGTHGRGRLDFFIGNARERGQVDFFIGYKGVASSSVALVGNFLYSYHDLMAVVYFIQKLTVRCFYFLWDFLV